MSVAFARKQAQRLIETHGIEGPAVDVRAMARSLGLTVVEADLDDDVSGLLVTTGEGSFIVVNEANGRNRKRFTIAHEIGHFVLGHHRDDGEVHVDRGNLISFRGIRASQGVDPKEIEANQFAASLLMPPSLVKAAAKRLGSPLLDQHVESLARLFQVSEQAMTIRLTTLRLL